MPLPSMESLRSLMSDDALCAGLPLRQPKGTGDDEGRDGERAARAAAWRPALSPSVPRLGQNSKEPQPFLPEGRTRPFISAAVSSSPNHAPQPHLPIRDVHTNPRWRHYLSPAAAATVPAAGVQAGGVPAARSENASPFRHSPLKRSASHDSSLTTMSINNGARSPPLPPPPQSPNTQRPSSPSTVSPYASDFPSYNMPVLFSGILAKEPKWRKVWRLVWAQLTPHYLFYFDLRTRELRGTVPLLNSRINKFSCVEYPFAFCVVADLRISGLGKGMRNFFFGAQAESLRDGWVEAIRGALTCLD